MVALFATLTFVGAFLAALAAVTLAWMWSQRRAAPASSTAPQPESGGGSSGLLRDDSLSTISVWDAVLTRTDFVAGLKAMLAESGLHWSVGRVTALMLLLGITTLVVANSIELIPGWAAILLGAGAASLPYLYIKRRRDQRLHLFSEQFPEALDSMASSLRAGHPVIATFYLVGQDFAEPLGPEWRRAFEECKLGLPIGQALENLSRRVPVVELGLLAAAIQLQSRTGGNLGEVLGRLSDTVREAAALQGEIRAIASHGRLTGMILTLLPLAIVAIMAYMNPHHFDVLLQHPYGKHLIAAAIACLVLAHFVIGRIVDIKL